MLLMASANSGSTYGDWYSNSSDIQALIVFLFRLMGTL